jgi:hypothetical protein
VYPEDLKELEVYEEWRDLLTFWKTGVHFGQDPYIENQVCRCRKQSTYQAEQEPYREVRGLHSNLQESDRCFVSARFYTRATAGWLKPTENRIYGTATQPVISTDVAPQKMFASAVLTFIYSWQLTSTLYPPIVASVPPQAFALRSPVQLKEPDAFTVLAGRSNGSIAFNHKPRAIKPKSTFVVLSITRSFS